MSQESYSMPFKLAPVFNAANELVSLKRVLDTNDDGTVKWRQLRFAGPVNGPANSSLLDAAWLSLSIGGRDGLACVWFISYDTNGNPFQPAYKIGGAGADVAAGTVLTVKNDKRLWIPVPANTEAVSVGFNTGHIDYEMGVGFEIKPKGF